MKKDTTSTLWDVETSSGNNTALKSAEKRVAKALSLLHIPFYGEDPALQRVLGLGPSHG